MGALSGPRHLTPFGVITGGGVGLGRIAGMSELAQIGPVQLMSVGFEPGANFEGRIADELARLESEGTIRVLDLLFVARDTDSDELVVLEHQEESMGAVVGALLGLRLDDARGRLRAFVRDDRGARSRRWGNRSHTAARRALLLIEHVWARGLEARDSRRGRRSRSETSF